MSVLCGSASVYRAPRVDKPWGHELIFAAHDEKYVGKVIFIHAGGTLSLQYHQVKEETISILSGRAIVEYGPAERLLTTKVCDPGEAIHLPAGTVHRISAVDDLVLVECSTASPGWRADVVRLADSYGRAGTTAP